MRTSSIGMYAFRLTFGQASPAASPNAFSAVATPERVVTRSATMLAVFGIALSSFSLKQLLATNGSNKSSGTTVSLRKF